MCIVEKKQISMCFQKQSSVPQIPLLPVPENQICCYDYSIQIKCKPREFPTSIRNFWYAKNSEKLTMLQIFPFFQFFFFFIFFVFRAYLWCTNQSTYYKKHYYNTDRSKWHCSSCLCRILIVLCPEMPRLLPPPLQHLWKGIPQQGEHEGAQVS